MKKTISLIILKANLVFINAIVCFITDHFCFLLTERIQHDMPVHRSDPSKHDQGSVLD